MKTYSITQLKKLAKEQGYKLAALEDSTGKRIQSFNKLTTKIEPQLNTILNRLKSEIYEDGIYNVLLSRTINNCQEPDKYQVVKGTLKPAIIPVISEQPTPKAAEVLTWEGALKMQQEIADLKGQVQQLKFENNLLQSELDNIDESDLGEGTDQSNPTELKSGTQTFLSETLPSLLPILDKYFEQEDKKLDLKKLELAAKARKASRPQPVRKPIEIGSQEHLKIIEFYFTNKQQDKLDRELDKLEAHNESIYLQVCKALGIEIEEEEEEQEGTDGN